MVWKHYERHTHDMCWTSCARGANRGVVPLYNNSGGFWWLSSVRFCHIPTHLFIYVCVCVYVSLSIEMSIKEPPPQWVPCPKFPHLNNSLKRFEVSVVGSAPTTLSSAQTLPMFTSAQWFSYVNFTKTQPSPLTSPQPRRQNVITLSPHLHSIHNFIWIWGGEIATIEYMIFAHLYTHT